MRNDAIPLCIVRLPKNETSSVLIRTKFTKVKRFVRQ